MKKIEDIHNYYSAHDAAQVLSVKCGRPIRPDYISKMSHSRKHHIRVCRVRDRLLYHKEDINACTIGQKRSGPGFNDVSSLPGAPVDR